MTASHIDFHVEVNVVDTILHVRINGHLLGTYDQHDSSEQQQLGLALAGEVRARLAGPSDRVCSKDNT